MAASPSQRPGDGEQREGGRLRSAGEAALWLLVIGAAVVGALWVAGQLRLVVLPVTLALLLATLLWPGAHWLRGRGAPDALAALAVVLAFLAVLGGIIAIVAPRAVDGFQELDLSLRGGIDEVQQWLHEGFLSLSDTQINQAIDEAQQRLTSSAGDLASRAFGGAVVAAEVFTGLVLAVVVLFFFLKDGERIWPWLLGLVPARRRRRTERVASASWAALAGFLRGQTLVALFDSVFIALGLAILGVPLILPIAVITFFGAYVPIVGATLAGAVAVLVALFAEGLVTALLALGVVLLVQQLEGNVLQPYLVGRSVHVHPVAILLGVTAGGVIAGIIGIMVAGPTVAVAGAILRTLREPDSGEEEVEIWHPDAGEDEPDASAAGRAGSQRVSAPG